MIVDKLKWTLATLTVASVILVAAGAGLRALAGQGESKRTQGQERPAVAAGTQVVKHEAPQAEEEREKAANQVEEHRSEAELLEMETSALASAIKRNIGAIKEIETTPNLGTPSGINDNTAKYIEQLSERGQEMRKAYLTKRLKLAQLKRQIDRESKGLNEPVSEKSELAEMNQRLRALEAKIDQLVESLTKTPR